MEVVVVLFRKCAIPCMKIIGGKFYVQNANVRGQKTIE